MRSVYSRISAAGAAAVAALAGLGVNAVVVGPNTMPSATEARSPGQNLPPALPAAGQPVSPEDRRRWLRSRYTSPRYRALRRPTGTHKQNRRRLLAGR